MVRFTAIRANARIIPGPEIVAALDDYTLEYCGEVVLEVSEYPPVPPPPNTYVRTGRLLTYWRVVKQAIASYRIINPTQDRWGRYYAGYVHGPSGQTGFHAAHGWKNIRDHIDRPKFQRGAQAIISGMSGAH